MLTLLKREDADTEAFTKALERLSEHLKIGTETDRAAWKQAFYFIYLLIFYRRSIKERNTLDQILSEHHETLGLSQQEKTLMQTMAEHYLEQGMEKGIEQGMEKGIEQGMEKGARHTSIESTLRILDRRFPEAEVAALHSTLEAIENLEQLKMLNIEASVAESFHAFRDLLKP